MDKLSPHERENIQKMTDPSVLKLARGSLQQSVSLELRKSAFAKSSNDPMVLKLVKSYESTIFLMVTSTIPLSDKVLTNLGLVLPIYGCS